MTLFIDARKMGVLIDRIHRELTAEEIKKVSDCYPPDKQEKATQTVLEQAELICAEVAEMNIPV